MTELPDEIVFDQLTRAFAASQDFPRAEIVRRQTALLERLVRFARAQVPFYRDGDRLAPLFRADGRFDMAGWHDVPILTREEAKANEAALQAERLPADTTVLATRATSGTTGTPLNFRQTRLQFFAAEVWLNRLLQWHGLWPIRRIATHGAGTVAREPGPGMLKVPGGLDFAEQVELLRRHRITHVVSAPSVGAAWAEAAADRLPDLVAFVATGEILRTEVRATIERRLGGKVVNLYSTSELGPLAGEGPDGRLRVAEETAYLEGPGQGRGSGPGQGSALGSGGAEEAGRFTRVVVTPLYAFATPLLRYAPGDYVRFASGTPKRPQGLRRLEEVAGRRRNLLLRPDGRRFLPGRIVARSLAAILDHRAWQLVQTSRTDVVLKMVVPSPPSEAAVAALRRFVAQSLPEHRTDVEFVETIGGDLVGGKGYDMFLCLVDE